MSALTKQRRKKGGEKWRLMLRIVVQPQACKISWKCLLFFYYCSASVKSTPFCLLALHQTAFQPISLRRPCPHERTPVCFLRKVPPHPTQERRCNLKSGLQCPTCLRESLNRSYSTREIKPWRESWISGALLIPIFLEPLQWRWLILEWLDWEHSRAPPGDGFQGRTWRKWD